MSYTVIGSPISPFVRKVMLALNEKGVSYEHQDANPFAPPDGFREISPLGRIPAFRHDDRVINDSSVHLVPTDTAIQSPPSPLRPDLFAAIDASLKAVLGPIPISPTMETGATDGLYFRNAGIPVYGFTGIFLAVDDNRMHGKDERILIKAFDDALDFTYDVLKRIGRER